MRWIVFAVCSLTFIACSSEREGDPAPTVIAPTEDSANPSDDAKHSSKDVVHSSEDVTTPSKDSDGRRPDGKTGGGGTSGLHPRYVLHDADGNPVKAMVRPARFQPKLRDLSPGDEFDPESVNPTCFSVVSKGGNDVPSVPYSFENGKIAPCVEEIEESSLVVTSSDCSPSRQYPFVHVGDVRGTAIKTWKGEVVWASGQVRRVEPIYDVVAGSCERLNVVRHAITVQPVPSSLKNAFDNPPYTLKVRY